MATGEIDAESRIDDLIEFYDVRPNLLLPATTAFSSSFQRRTAASMHCERCRVARGKRRRETERKQTNYDSQ